VRLRSTAGLAPRLGGGQPRSLAIHHDFRRGRAGPGRTAGCDRYEQCADPGTWPLDSPRAGVGKAGMRNRAAQRLASTISLNPRAPPSESPAWVTPKCFILRDCQTQFAPFEKVPDCSTNSEIGRSLAGRGPSAARPKASPAGASAARRPPSDQRLCAQLLLPKRGLHIELGAPPVRAREHRRSGDREGAVLLARHRPETVGGRICSRVRGPLWESCAQPASAGRRCPTGCKNLSLLPHAKARAAIRGQHGTRY
jgi:hypothetical protein